MQAVNLSDVKAAADRIAEYVHRTPVMRCVLAAFAFSVAFGVGLSVETSAPHPLTLRSPLAGEGRALTRESSGPLSAGYSPPSMTPKACS
jgi:hypothetical protein